MLRERSGLQICPSGITPPGEGASVIVAIVLNLLQALLFPLHALRRARAAPSGAWLTLTLDGPVVDLASRRPRWSPFRRLGRAPLSIARLRELARTMALDPKVRGLFLEVRSPGGGPAVLASLRDVILEIRAAGKDVIAYLPRGADNRSLYLASAARLVLVGPATMVAPLGFAAHGRYVRRALDRLGVEPEVFARGVYKSAGESLVRDTMSDAQREQLGALLEAFHDALVAALAQGRKVAREVAARWIDEAPHSADEAVDRGLADAVAHEDDLDRFLAPDAPEGGRARLVPAERYLRQRLATRFRPVRRRAVIGVIEIHGPIVAQARIALSRVAAEAPLIAAIRAARRDPRVRGILLHIDSPGGSALASDRIYHEVLRAAEVKPVIAYLSNVAASGGYYIAAAADAVIAQRQTVTGSIGVVATRFVVGPLLERLGVFTDVVKRGARADLFSPSRRLDAAERALFEREIDAFYQTFLRAVARGRNRPIEAIEPLARGRIYSGTDAHACGLVDYLGGFERALHEMRDRLGAAGKGLEPAMIRAPRHALPPPPIVKIPAMLQAALDALTLTPLLEAAAIGLDCEPSERVLAYWSGIEIH
jgi:protease-4